MNPEKINIEKLDLLPESVLTNITVNPESTEPPGQSGDNIFNTGQSAQSTDTGSIPGNSGASPKIGTSVPFPKSGAGKAGDYVSGEFATSLMDNMIPSLIVYIVSQFGYLIEKKMIQLTEKEKGLIAPAMQNYLDSINIDFSNPLYNLLFVIGCVYAPKVFDILPTVRKKMKVVPKEKQPETEVAAIEKKLDDRKERENKKRAEIERLTKMPRVVAMQWIIDNKKLSKKDAAVWYQKNVAA